MVHKLKVKCNMGTRFFSCSRGRALSTRSPPNERVSASLTNIIKSISKCPRAIYAAISEESERGEGDGGGGGGPECQVNFCA